MKLHFPKKRFLAIILVLFLVSITYTATTFTGGGPAARTNAPGEGNCTACHSGTLQTSGTNYNNISFSGPFTGGGYIPDSVYDVTLSYSHTGLSKFGFSATTLDGTNAYAGTLSSINATTGIVTGTVSGASRTYIRHTSSGTSGSGGRSWTFRWTAPSSNVGDVTLYAVVNATNGNGATSGDVVIAKEFTISPSTLLPTASASASSTTVCANTAVSLTGSGTNTPTSYSWSLLGGSPSSSSSQNPSVVYANQGTYNAVLVVSNAKGASQPDTVTITVNPSPTAFIAGGATRTICTGDSVELAANFFAGSNYTWMDGTPGHTIWAKDSGDYYVNVVGSNGCARSSNVVSVSLLPRPSATLSSNASNFNDSSCTNATLTLQASSSAFDSFYYYANGVEIGRGTQSTFTTTFTATTTYGLVVKDAMGCKSLMDSYTVTEKMELAPPAVVCSIRTPNSIEYSFSSPFSHLGFQVSVDSGFLWQTPSSGATGNTHVVTGLQPEDSLQLWVRAIDQAPCFYSQIGIKTCISDTCSQLMPTYQVDAAYCLGETATVEINGLAGQNYGLTFEGGNPFTDTIFQFQPTITKNYVLTVTDSNSLTCPANIIDIPITVDRINTINLQFDKLGAYCTGETVTLTANDTLDNFDFILNGTSVQQGSNNTYVNANLSNGDEVQVVVQKGVCTDSSQVEVVNIEPLADASFTYSRLQSVYTFTPTINTHASYLWDFGDLANSTDVAPSHDYASSEGQTVTANLSVTTANGCDNAASQSIVLPAFSGVDILNRLGISAYPNPVERELVIENKDGKSGSLQITTLNGQVLLTDVLQGQMQTIDMSALAKGSYILIVEVDGEKSKLNILKN